MSNHLLMTSCGWYFRMAVPSDLRLKVGKREIKKPLCAPDKKSAIRKARILACETDELFEILRGNNMSWKRRSMLPPGMTEMVVKRGDGPNAVSVDLTVEEVNQLTSAARLDLFGSAQFPNVETLQASLTVEQPSTLRGALPEMFILPHMPGFPLRSIPAPLYSPNLRRPTNNEGNRCLDTKTGIKSNLCLDTSG